MSNRINFLPPWVETNIQPAFYDKQSGTCIQQTARMYAKVNQLVRIANEQYAKIEEYIAKFVELKDYVEDYFDNLDVQEEINNKLDAMVEDGTFQQVLDAYIQPTIDAFEADVATTIKGLQDELAGVASGTPIPVSSTSGMTDTTKTYLNTSDGKWYYYNTSNSTWTIGGTYQATGIADGSVAGNALYEGEASARYSYVQNYFLNSSGEPSYNTSWEYCAEYFPIHAGDTYTLTNVRASAIFFYDTDKELINYTNVGNSITDYTHTVSGDSVAYARIQFPKGYTHKFIINGKDVLNKYYAPWLRVKTDNLDFTPSGLDGSLLVDDSVYRDKLILDNGEELTVNSYWTLKESAPYYQSNNNWYRFTNLIEVQTGDVIEARNVQGSWGVMFDESDIAIASAGNLPNVGNASYTVLEGQYKIGFNVRKNVRENAEFYINGKKIVFDNGSRATIEWLTLTEEQKAEVSNYDLSRFKNYNVLFIGDSITANNYRALHNWVEYLTDDLRITSFDNVAVSGSGILRSSGASNGWLYDLENYATGYDLILIMGDMNDWSVGNIFDENNIGSFGDGTTSTFYGTMKLYLEALLTKYPLAKIGWITSTPRDQQITGTSDYLHGKSSIFETANNVIKEMCNNYSIPVLELYKESSLYPWLEANNEAYFKSDVEDIPADAIHPNSAGQKIMEIKIKDFVIRNF